MASQLKTASSRYTHYMQYGHNRRLRAIRVICHQEMIQMVRKLDKNITEVLNSYSETLRVSSATVILTMSTVIV